MNLLMKLRADLLELSQKQCASVKNQNLVPEDLHLYYALYEYDQVFGKMKKVMNDRLEVGVTWDQISALHSRVTGAQGRYERSRKKQDRLQKAFKEAPNDKSIQAKLKSAQESCKKAGGELKLMNDLSEKVGAYKKAQRGENHG